jgi:hypothetical protein
MARPPEHIPHSSDIEAENHRLFVVQPPLTIPSDDEKAFLGYPAYDHTFRQTPNLPTYREFIRHSN